MKNTSKWIAATAMVAAIFFTSNVKAQTAPATTTDPSPWRLGIGIEGGLPTGDAHSPYNWVLGGTARLQYDASKDFAWTLTSGYDNFFGKSNVAAPLGGTYNVPNFGIVPVKLGVKAFFAPNIYFGAEAGAGFETESGGNTKLILAPALGYANKSWDIALHYENFSGQGDNFGIAGIRVAYAFGL